MLEILMPAVFLAGLMVGAVGAWMVVKSRTAVLLSAAVIQAESSAQAELIQLRERVRASDESRRELHDSLAASERRVADVWGELGSARQELAVLTERAGRLLGLEQELQAARSEADIAVQNTYRFQSDAATQAKAAELLANELREVKANNVALRHDLDDLEDTLNAITDRRATLEEQVVQLASLRQEHAALLQHSEAIQTSLNTANERKAGLEEQVLQMSELRKALADTAQLLEARTVEHNDLRHTSAGELATLRGQIDADQATIAKLGTDLTQESERLVDAVLNVNRLTLEMREANLKVEAERGSAANRLRDLLSAKEALSDQFKTLANDILEDKSRRFTEQNKESLGQLLEPLKGQLSEFKNKVEEVYVTEGKDRSALASQVKELVGLNQALSQEAKNLTSALKGSSKTQGSWGELILERVLEASGLRKDYEYVVQDSQRNEDGSRQQPDVVMHLPGDRRLVVDAKVSLVAHEQCVSADTDEGRALALRKHLDSVRNHIKLLSEKKYHELYKLQTIDFVLMFVPIEPAFTSAITHDDSLFMNAWERNVLLVSPSTLLFVVRTVAHLWRQDAQSRNVQDIAKRGADLYDKLVDFVKDLDNVGDKLNAAQKSYGEAHKRLSTGRGNLISQADKLRSLGIKPNKQLAQPLVDASHDALMVSELSTLVAVAVTHPSTLDRGEIN